MRRCAPPPLYHAAPLFSRPQRSLFTQQRDTCSEIGRVGFAHAHNTAGTSPRLAAPAKHDLPLSLSLGCRKQGAHCRISAGPVLARSESGDSSSASSAPVVDRSYVWRGPQAICASCESSQRVHGSRHVTLGRGLDRSHNRYLRLVRETTHRQEVSRPGSALGEPHVVRACAPSEEWISPWARERANGPIEVQEVSPATGTGPDTPIKAWGHLGRVCIARRLGEAHHGAPMYPIRVSQRLALHPLLCFR